VVPSYLSVLLEEMSRRGGQPLLAGLDYVLVTGETLNVALVHRWQQRYPGVKLVNAYGPTEASDDVTQCLVGTVAETGTVPIGKPLPNVTLYVADAYGRRCPPGIRGEILVSGICVGRGYWKDAEKTARSFTEDPFAGTPGVRLYRTGDVGSWLPDGNLAFHGRRDEQVKVRGNRVEIGEVESVLLRFGGVREGVVLPAEDQHGNVELVAYLVAAGPVETRDLRQFMLGLLPEYMVPASFNPVDRLPVTPSGKIDRQELLTWKHAPGGARYVAPRNPTEEKLLAIWSEVLGRPGIGVTDNLYEIGGHSLVTIQIISRISEVFGVDIEISFFFLNPTIEGIASRIDAVKWVDDCQADEAASPFPEILI
jgi:surfactin family lipopeptide synthetase A/fengycin family lipopeptide synthetase D